MWSPTSPQSWGDDPSVQEQLSESRMIGSSPHQQLAGAPSASAHEVRVLVLSVSGRDYALPIERVIEVVQMVDITPVPGAPPWMDGIIDFRGVVAPVIDCRTRLGVPRQKPMLGTPIVLVSGRRGTFGVIVDSVEGLLAVPSPEAIPSTEDIAGSAAVSAVIHHDERIILILDADRLSDRALGMLPLRGKAAFDFRQDRLA